MIASDGYTQTPASSTTVAVEVDARTADMVARRARGVSLEQIGAAYGVTRERARQIIRGAGGPTSAEARRVAAEVKAAAQRARRDEFATTYLSVARELAAKGESMRAVVARLTAIDPSIDEEVAASVLRSSRIVFSHDWTEDHLSDAAVIAALWFAFGLDYQIPANAATAVTSLDSSTLNDVVEVLMNQGVGEAERARVLGVIAAARKFAAENPKVTLTGARYQQIRSMQLAQWGLLSAKGSTLWPPTRQTTMARFGGWSEALERAGLRRSTMGRDKGLLKYSVDDYHEAVDRFVEWADARAVTPSVDRWTQWRGAESAEGRERPSSASVRNVFGSWSQAIRASRERGIGS